MMVVKADLYQEYEKDVSGLSTSKLDLHAAVIQKST